MKAALVMVKAYDGTGGCSSYWINAKAVRGEFAVHRRIVDIQDDKPVFSSDWWTITHIPTQSAVLYRDKLRDAKRVAGELAGFPVPYKKTAKWLKAFRQYVYDNAIA